MHQNLDEDTSLAMKVIFNLLLRLKQYFRESKDFSPLFTVVDKPASFLSEFNFSSKHKPLSFFLDFMSYSHMDQMLFSKPSSTGDASEGGSGTASALSQISASRDEKRSNNSLYLNNYVFRKTYVTI